MVRADLLRAKLAELAERAARVRNHQRPTVEALGADRDALDVVCFNLMLAVQTCSDIAAHIISDEGWAAPSTLAGAFDRLVEHGVVTAETCDAMRRAVRFRNVVAHGYAALDVRAAFVASTAGLLDLDSFAREVARWIEGRGA
ncbi:MAG: DUF86 domain-containing protein [Sandaracinus sp.]